MGCKYCENGEGFGDKHCNDEEGLKIIKYTNQYLLYYGLGYYDRYDSFDKEAIIKFCPMCGKKLIN